MILIKLKRRLSVCSSITFKQLKEISWNFAQMFSKDLLRKYAVFDFEILSWNGNNKEYVQKDEHNSQLLVDLCAFLSFLYLFL